jgi:FkbM family methyltransferase
MTTGLPEAVASSAPPQKRRRILAGEAWSLQVVRELQWLHSRLTRLRRLTHLVSAVRIMLLQRRAPVVTVPLKAIASVCRIRQWSSDLECLEQIFVHEEYSIPFTLKPMVIVDAGANIGAASLYFAHKYPGAKIFALEPELSNFQLLQENCAGFANVFPIRAALWSGGARVALADPNEDKWAFSVRDVAADAGTIPAMTVDALMDRFGIQHIDLLKLDIEGAEKEVFSSNSTDWLDHVTVIAIELHDRYKPGCAEAFYSALHGRRFAQEIRGENIFINLLSGA